MPEELKELIVGLTQAIEKLNVLADQNIEMNTMAMPMIKKMLPVCEKIFGAMEPYSDALAESLASGLYREVKN